MTSMLNQNNFDATFLGQSILRYQVPLDIYISINKIYESKYSTFENMPDADPNICNLPFCGDSGDEYSTPKLFGNFKIITLDNPVNILP